MDESSSDKPCTPARKEFGVELWVIFSLVAVEPIVLMLPLCFSFEHEHVIVDDSNAPNYTVTYTRSGYFKLRCEFIDEEDLVDVAETNVTVCMCQGEGNRR